MRCLQNSPGLKICGITTLDDVMALSAMGIEALGANFFPKSKRFLTDGLAAEILPPVAGQIERVGVFVNEPIADILRRLDAGWIDVAQLHGEESAADVAQIKAAGFPVVKAVAGTEEALANALDYEADALLIDTPAGAEYGGTGRVFDWSLAAVFVRENPNLPVFLAGGITPDNAAEALNCVNPAMLDVASGAEISPGRKDFDKVAALQRAVLAKRGGARS